MNKNQAITFNNIPFILPHRYNQNVHWIGNGGFGAVIGAYDLILNTEVAIKRIKFNQDAKDFKDLVKVIREIVIFSLFNHENIVKLRDSYWIHSNTQSNQYEVYLVLEKVDTNLQGVIQSKQQLSEGHYKYIIFQILKALLYLSSAKITHRDIKPSNILLTKKTEVKLTDFGLGKYFGNSTKIDDSSSAIGTWNYRAPELIFENIRYLEKTDIWSLGCVMAELISKKIVFSNDNSKDIQHYVIRLINISGVQQEDFEFIENDTLRRQITKLVKKNPPTENCGIENFIHSTCVGKNYNNREGLDLLKKMLMFSPIKRISIEDAINHPYFQGFRDTLNFPPSIDIEKIEKEFSFEK